MAKIATSRRRLLSSLILTVVAFPSTSAMSTRREGVTALLPHLHAARLIGSHYLALVPQERSAARLSESVFGDIDAAVDGPDALAHLRRLVDARRHRDFSTGDTVILNGWLLARTEARLCALSTLL
ncbi:MAG: hypothetical protein ACOY4R_00355 [Pseudomonadota bacterium]